MCDFCDIHSNKLFNGILLKIKVKTGCPRIGFSPVTEEQTLEISRDGVVRFQKSNILDTEEEKKFLSPEATAMLFHVFSDFFTTNTLPKFQCSNRQWWVITLITDNDIYFYNAGDIALFSHCGQNLINLLQRTLTIDHLFLLENPEYNDNDSTSDTHHEIVSALLTSFDKDQYRNILF